MDTQQDRLLQFDRDLLSGKNICSSRGVLVTFPSSLKKLFHMKGPELNRMKQAAEKGMFDAIFVVNRDRLFRGRWTEAPMFPVPIIVADEVRMKRKEEHLH